MEVLNCGWESKVSKGKNLKQKNEAWEDVGLLGFHKENTLDGGQVFYTVQCRKKKKEFQHVFSKQLMFLVAQGNFFLVVANDLVQG